MRKTLLALALACHGAAAWTASDATIHNAVRLWLDDRDAALEAYGPIGAWDTSQITDMQNLFCADPVSSWCGGETKRGAETFDDDISAWDTSKVTTFKQMFRHARAFNAPIGTWETGSALSLDRMFRYLGMCLRARRASSQPPRSKVGCLCLPEKACARDFCSGVRETTRTLH